MSKEFKDANEFKEFFEEFRDDVDERRLRLTRECANPL